MKSTGPWNELHTSGLLDSGTGWTAFDTDYAKKAIYTGSCWLAHCWLRKYESTAIDPEMTIFLVNGDPANATAAAQNAVYGAVAPNSTTWQLNFTIESGLWCSTSLFIVIFADDPVTEKVYACVGYGI